MGPSSSGYSLIHAFQGVRSIHPAPGRAELLAPRAGIPKELVLNFAIGMPVPALPPVPSVTSGTSWRVLGPAWPPAALGRAPGPSTQQRSAQPGSPCWVLMVRAIRWQQEPLHSIPASEKRDYPQPCCPQQLHRLAKNPKPCGAAELGSPGRTRGGSEIGEQHPEQQQGHKRISPEEITLWSHSPRDFWELTAGNDSGVSGQRGHTQFQRGFYRS